jgi:DNA-binding PucR family transcriptional regulator
MKIFIEKNQNTSEAAKALYLHRNTLINRLDKFYRVTGFDLKKFEDAAIIYLLIKEN